jgi:hypothetical protein
MIIGFFAALEEEEEKVEEARIISFSEPGTGAAAETEQVVCLVIRTWINDLPYSNRTIRQIK